MPSICIPQTKQCLVLNPHLAGHLHLLRIEHSQRRFYPRCSKVLLDSMLFHPSDKPTECFQLFLTRFCSLMIFVLFFEANLRYRMKIVNRLKVARMIIEKPILRPFRLVACFSSSQGWDTLFGGQRLTEHRWEHHENTTTIFCCERSLCRRSWYYMIENSTNSWTCT